MHESSENAVAIRRFAPSDHAAVKELWCSAWEATLKGIDFRARWALMLAQWEGMLKAGGAAYVADFRGAVAGFIVTMAQGGHLEQIAVAPGLFGSPVARALMDFAKARSPGRLTLAVNTFNVRAVRFYEREGFSRIGADMNGISGLPVWTYEWRLTPCPAAISGARSGL
jgi:putative acetyltransferase